MPDIANFFDEIDLARARRAKELSEVKRLLAVADAEDDPSGVRSKAAIVLAYANWEGFYNDCVRLYILHLSERNYPLQRRDWMLLCDALTAEFDSLRDKNHSGEARRHFVERLQDKLNCDFSALSGKTVTARSNLDFDRLRENYRILSFDIGRFQRYRNRLDKELVGWRHSVAHGDTPDLSTLDIERHVDFAGELLIAVADIFQEAMLERSSSS